MNKILVIAGMSCSGKTKIRNILNDMNIISAISTTTRKRRTKEIEGKDYYFISDEDFENKIDKMIEYTIDIREGKKCYFGLNSENISDNSIYNVVVNVEGYNNLVEKYGKENVKVLWVERNKEDRRESSKRRDVYTDEFFEEREKTDIETILPLKQLANYVHDFPFINIEFLKGISLSLEKEIK